MARVIGRDRRFVQTNASDLLGNIYRSKNINLDEEGYIKLSPRTASLISSETDTNFNIPVAFGRKDTGNFLVATVENPYEIQIYESAVSATEDTDAGGDTPPNLTTDSRGGWWQNRWYVTDTDGLYYKTLSNGNWTDASVSLTASVAHPIAVFRTSVNQTLCIGNGNTVKQIDTSHATTNIAQLTIPSMFEVVGLAHNGNFMAVATKLSDSASNQNGEAMLYIWDGLGTSANDGIGVGSDGIVDVVAYKSSFVCLTREGNLLYYNGGGFDLLASLPVYFSERSWGDSVNLEVFGHALRVSGEIIYINVNNSSEQFGNKLESYLAPGGVLCFDPRVGIYHRMSPSISPASLLTVTTGNVDTATNIFTKTAGTVPTTGSPIKYVSTHTAQIEGLTFGTVYYCIYLSSTTFKLASTRANAIDGTAIDITAQSASTSYFLAIELRDYSASYMERTGAIGIPEKPTPTLDSLIFGGEYFDYNSTNDYEHICFSVSGFKNIGYVVTTKLTSEQIKDFWGRGGVMHRRLKEGEKIIIKVQYEDIVGLPVSTPQGANHCNWTSPSSFYITGDLSEAKTYLDSGKELECEIISGAGAGQMIQIDSIAHDSGIYSVVLKEEAEGTASGYVSDVLIENWKILKTITDTDTQSSMTPLEAKGEWAKLKIIMEGSAVAIYEIPVANQTQQQIA